MVTPNYNYSPITDHDSLVEISPCRLFSPGAPVDNQTDRDQEERAASDLRFVEPNVGSAGRWNQGDDHGQERDRQAADTHDQGAGRAAWDD